MSGLSNALWFWLPVLIYKAVSALFRTIWKFNLWVLQTICGVPLYYSRPEYRIMGIFLGTVGLMFVFNFVMFLLIMGSEAGDNLSQQGMALREILIMGGVGLGLLVLCRILIRRGSI